MPLKVYKRPGSVVWHYRGTLAGRRLRGSTGTPDRQTAEEVAAKVTGKFYDRSLDSKEKGLTWPKAVALYLAAGKPSRFLANLVKHFGDVKIADLNAGSMRQSAIDLYPKAKNSTRNRAVIVPMQAVINHCAELQLCPHLKVKRFKVDTKIKKPATLEWINAFRENADRVDIGVLALFMFATGARISEALAVRWDDIDLRGRTVLIRQTKLGNERRAHLPTDLFLALANLPRNCKPFPWATDTSAAYSWKATIKKAGIDPLTFHSCRHGFATALLHKGVDVVTIAKLGGWKSPAHVFQTYGHARNDLTLTDLIFGTASDTADTTQQQNQLLTANSKLPY
jgi:integrase